MGIYIATFALSISIAFCMLHYKDGIISIANKYDGSRNLLITIMAGMPLFLLSALRKGIGTDYWVYYDHVRYFDTSSESDAEWLYYLISKFIRQNGIDPQWFFVITSAVFIFITMYTIISKSEMPELSIFLLFGAVFYFYSYNETRQMFASAILLLSLPFAEKRKFIPFLLIVLLAAGMHYSSYAYIAVYFIYDKYENPFKTIIIILISIIFYDVIANIAINFIAITNYSEYVSDAAEGIVFWNRLLVNVVVLVFSMFYFNYKNNQFKLLYVLQVLTVFVNLFNSSVNLSRRMNLTFGLPVVLFLPLILKNIKSDRDRRLITMAVVILYFLYAYIGVKRGLTGAYPYASIFD